MIPAAAWLAAGAVSSCVGPAKRCSTAGAAQAHAAAGHPCCGQLAGTGRSKPLSQHSVKRNHQPDRKQGTVFIQTQLIQSALIEAAVEKHAAAPQGAALAFPASSLESLVYGAGQHCFTL